MNRDEACCGQLQELNTYVKVSVQKQPLTLESFKNYDVVIFTENYDQLDLEKVNAFCRAQNIGFIYAG